MKHKLLTGVASIFYILLRLYAHILDLYSFHYPIKPKKILVISFGGIGDALLITPFLKNLKHAFPESVIHVLLSSRGAKEILCGNPNIDEILFSPSILNMSLVQSMIHVKKLRKEKYDMAISTMSALPSTQVFEQPILCVSSGAKIRVGYQGPAKNIFNFSCLYNYSLPLDLQQHVIDCNNSLISTIVQNYVPECRTMKIFYSDKDKQFAERFLRDKNISDDVLIGIHPGSGNQTWKRWSADKYLKVADFFIKNFGFKVLYFCGPDESTIKNLFLPSDDSIVVSGCSLKEVSALIARCRYFISGDTGLMHIAVATKNPRVIAIFGSTNPIWSAPFGEKHLIIRKDLFCSPCYLEPLVPGEEVECETLDCLKLISVKDVLQKIDNLLLL